ncbi:hypothetical protein ACEQ8H_000279 [Pleosporales sp. CAS-2024a]
MVDFHYISYPTVDLDEIPYDIVLVQRLGQAIFNFRKLDDGASEKARQLCRQYG